MRTFVYAVVLAAVVAVSEAKTLRWYISSNRIDANLEFAKQNRGAMSGFYGCCNAVAVDAEGVMTADVAEMTNQTVHYHGEGLTYHLMGSLNETGVLNGNCVKAVEDVVAVVKQTGAEGIIFDYEPKNNFTVEHAQLYSNFLAALKKAAGNSFEVGMDVSGWGILDFFSTYATADLDIYTSMSITYHADTALSPAGTYFINNMTEYYGANHSFYGIGTWDTDESTCLWHYEWNVTALNTFLTSSDAQHVDMWRCDIEHYATPAPEMIQALQKWFQS